MNLKEYNYNLPKTLIAQSQIKPRDSSRLMVVRTSGLGGGPIVFFLLMLAFAGISGGV